MARKKDVVKKIDQKTKNSGAPLPLIQEDQPTPPAFAVIPAPDTLIEVSQAIQRSTQAPLVLVAISWNEAPNINPDYYNVDVSETADFTNKIRRRALSTSATIDGLKANGFTYYMRVQAVIGGIYSDFSNTLTVVTMDDDTPPPDVTGATAAFQNSDLVITYTIPQSEILKDVQIDIYNSAHTVHYGTFYTRSERFVWTAEQNIFATGGVPLKQVSVDIHTRSWSNQNSLIGVNVTATAPIPATPTGYTSNWIGDSGTASGDFITAWLGAANANDYQLTIDGKDYFTRDLKFIYSYEQNVADHAPTIPSGDPSFIWLLKARDKLGQSSIPVNVTVTNAAPPSGIMSMNVSPGFGTLGVTVSLLGNTIVQDFDHFEWKVWNGSSYVRTVNTPDPSVIFDLSTAGAGTYTPSVTMVDKFNQRSATVSGAPQVLDVLTIEQLRAETTYTDWLGTAANVLLRLKDGVLYDGSGAYVFYAPNAGWQWLEAQRPLLDRYKTITFSAFWGAGLLMYIEVDTPTGTVYYAGPATVNPNGSYQLTRYTVLATAQTNAYAFGTAGNGTRRFDFTRIEESRRIRIWFKDTVSNTGIYEYYARRLVQSDDIEVESLRSINIAALGINADRIFVTTLSAFTAFIGQLNIDATGWLYQGSGTGSSPVTGLKIFNSGGIGKLSTYNGGVEQITLDTDGRFKAGAGSVIIDAAGIRLVTPASATYTSVSSIDFIDTVGNRTSSLRGYNFSGFNYAKIESVNVAGRPGAVSLIATGGSRNATLGLTASNGGYSVLDINASRLELRSTESTYGGYEGIWFFASPSSSVPDMVLSAGATPSFGINVQLNAGPVAIGASYFVPTRDLSLSGTNTYISWNDASGTEHWVAGYEGSISGRWVLYNNATGNYPIIVNSGNSIDLAETTTINNGNGGWFQMNNNGGGASRRNGLRFYKNGTQIWEFGSDYDATGGQSMYFYDAIAGAHRVVIGSLGGVQIAYRMYIGAIGGSPSYQIHLSADSAGKPTTNTWTVVSDERTKKNVKPFDHGLKDLRAFPMPVSFNYNGVNGTPDDGSQGIGYIAQHVQKVAPKMVSTDDNGFLHINTGAMQMMFHKSIIEIDDRVIALEKRIKELEVQLQ
jgi:hypothetical protein